MYFYLPIICEINPYPEWHPSPYQTLASSSWFNAPGKPQIFVIFLCAINASSSAIDQPSSCKLVKEPLAAALIASAVLQSMSISSKSFLRLNSRAMFHKQRSFVTMWFLSISSYSFSISVSFRFSKGCPCRRNIHHSGRPKQPHTNHPRGILCQADLHREGQVFG